MRFASPEFFLLLLLLPAGWFLHRWVFARRPGGFAPTFSFANFLALRATGSGTRSRLAQVVPVLRVLALVVLVVALARPQIEDWETLSGEGLDIMICLDMSGSMNAVDMSFDEIDQYHTSGKEPPGRFSVAIDTLKRFIGDRQGDRVGLVVFSSEAYLKFPLTLDYETALNQLDSLVLDSLERDAQRPGCVNQCTIHGEKTAVGDALAKAFKRLEKSDAKGKLLVLITDGNDNASKLKPLDVAQYIGSQPDGQRPAVYAFLVGGGPKAKMPQQRRGRRLRTHLGFLAYDKYQETVDEEKIKEMVDAAQGVFHISYDVDEFKESFASLERSEYMEQKIARHKELFMPVLLLALLLLGLEFLGRVAVFRRYP